jgi:hypothetical protein
MHNPWTFSLTNAGIISPRHEKGLHEDSSRLIPTVTSCLAQRTTGGSTFDPTSRVIYTTGLCNDDISRVLRQGAKK